MNFLADESVDQPIVVQLRADGHTVVAKVEMEPGITDETVLDIANQQHCILLTADKDFGELVFRKNCVSLCIILIRLSGLTAKAKAELVGTAVKEHAGRFIGSFTVLSKNNIRIRPRLL
jgi:predicted nuclease of predicted toxin-antitoxin system